uniref:Afadin n=1 Tax=Rhabditophanes sp. KR3021 TaxID=114890 RepID=A0AC35UBP0_9BILA
MFDSPKSRMSTESAETGTSHQIMANLEAQKEQLTHLIDEWNESRLELFAISHPDENLDIYGVMRFYFRDNGEKVSSKCIRVASTADTNSVIEALLEKFRPDMKMLTTPQYSLWEAQNDGVERKLDPMEKPLLVQLNWHKDCLEGKFILKNDNAEDTTSRVAPTFSKRHKKESKSGSKSSENSKKCAEATTITEEVLRDASSANPFNRTISNPEVVMKKRREQKLENKLKEMMGNGGSLKIYGYSLNPNKNYVSLLVSTSDTTSKLLRETLDKYGLCNHQIADYILTQRIVPQSILNQCGNDLQSISNESLGCDESVLTIDECPLMNVLYHQHRHPDHANSEGDLVFTIRRRPENMHPQMGSLANYSHQSEYHFPDHGSPIFSTKSVHGTTPVLIPIDIVNGKENFDSSILIKKDITIIGSDPALSKNQDIYDFNTSNLQPNINLLTSSPSSSISELLLKRFIHSSPTMPITTHFDANPYAAPVHTRKGSVNSLYSLQSTFNHLHTNDTLPPIIPTQALPGLIEIYEGQDDAFLNLLLNSSAIETVQFRPGPALILYMVMRHKSCTLYKPNIHKDVRNVNLINFFDAIRTKLHHQMYSNKNAIAVLAYWLTVSSEFLFICQADTHLHPILATSIGRLHDLVERCFSLLNDACQVRASYTMATFLDSRIDNGSASVDTINVFKYIIEQFNRNRVNTAIQIQIFYQLFHYLNMYIFNWMISTDDGLQHLTRSWSFCLKERLYNIIKWSEQYGLEMMAELHMDRIIQTVNLLTTPKRQDQVAVLGATCYRLNSKQVQFLLTHYIPDSTEHPISPALISQCIHMTQLHGQADEIARQSNTPIQLLEERKLKDVPFEFPLDSYVVEIIKDIHPAMMEQISSLQAQGVCRFYPVSMASGSWSVHFRKVNHGDTLSQASTELASSHQNVQSHANHHHSNQSLTPSIQHRPEVVSISFTRTPGSGIGLSIVAACAVNQGVQDKTLGIYVRKVFETGAAFKDGRIESGDQLVALNKVSLIGITQERAADIMAQAGNELHFKVAKNAAHFNGLSSHFGNHDTPKPSHPYQQKTPNERTYACPDINSSSNPSLNTYRIRTNSEHSHHPTHLPPTYSKQSVNSQLPSHYRIATRPPVIQPARPTTTSHSSISKGNQNGINQHNEYAALQEAMNRSVNVVPIQNRNRSASVLPFNQTTPQPHTTQPFGEGKVSEVAVQSHPLRRDFQNGRRSAPLFSEELSPRQLRERYHDELDALEAKGDEMSAWEMGRYRETIKLLGELSTSPGKMSSVSTKAKTTPPPFLSEMATRFEQKRQSQSSSLSATSSKPHQNEIEHDIDLVAADVKKMNMLVEEECKKGPKECSAKSISRVVVNDFGPPHQLEQLSPSSQEENYNPLVVKCKGVKMCDLPRRQDYEVEEDEEPRVQTIGTHEIYNDPRTRMLKESQSRSGKGKMDGSSLGFRDKMKMFASNLGESTPKSKVSTSSAQRDIESTLEGTKPL